MPRILAFAGSARTASVNKKLLHAAAVAAAEAGAEVTEIDLRDFPMPLYDGDLEEAEGQPEHAVRLRELMREHDALLVGCPEYNGLITPLLKNSIDWVSRQDEQGRPGTAAVKGKVAALTAASPGGLGGMRVLVHVRALLANIGMFVLPEQFSLPHAMKAFDEAGKLTDESAAARLAAMAAALVQATTRLSDG